MAKNDLSEPLDPKAKQPKKLTLNAFLASLIKIELPRRKVSEIDPVELVNEGASFYDNAKTRLLAACKKYALDLATNTFYMCGTILIAVVMKRVKPIADAASSIVDAGEHIAEEGEHIADEVEQQVEYTIAVIQQYWIILFGAFTMVILLHKNMTALINKLFEIMDTIEELVKTAIKTLRSKMYATVRANTSGALDTVAMTWMMKSGIDKAGNEFEVKKFMPCCLKSRCRFFFVVECPIIIAIIVYTAFRLKNIGMPSESSGNIETVEEKHVMLASAIHAAAGETADSGGSVVDFHTLLIQLKTVVINIFSGLLSTSFVIAKFINCMMGLLEIILNRVLLRIVKTRIPCDRLQAALDGEWSSNKEEPTPRESTSGRSRAGCCRRR